MSMMSRDDMSDDAWMHVIRKTLLLLMFSEMLTCI